MRDKLVRLAKALSNESVKRLPYVVFILVIVVFIQSIQNNQTAKSYSVDAKQLLIKVAALSEDNKRLNLQNRELAKQGTTLAAQAININKCIGYTFATYTQNLQPIAFTDIDRCIIQSAPAIEQQSSPSQLAVPQQSSPSLSVQPRSNPSVIVTPNTTPPATPAQPDTPQAPPNIIERAVGLIRNVLGLLG